VAAELKGAYSADAKLIEGSKGIFDVKVDGRLVYSKHQTHRFPEAGELTRLLGKG
jgi:selenoprotein W-related protein